jgi:hypothetical protein
LTEQALTNPIINSPYDPPDRYFEIGSNGPTGKLLTGRRPNESFIPIPTSKKGRKASEVEPMQRIYSGSCRVSWATSRFRFIATMRPTLHEPFDRIPRRQAGHLPELSGHRSQIGSYLAGLRSLH